jgi:N-acetylglucosamine-6-phosphate deacetylase
LSTRAGALAVTGGTLLRPNGPEPADLVAVDGRIKAIVRRLDQRQDLTVVDATGLYVAPGFLDLQVNGAAGVDLATEPSKVWEVAAALPRHGVTGFLPTIVSGASSTIEVALEALRHRPDGVACAAPIGLHLEGPFLSPLRRGAHPAYRLRPPSLVAIEGWTRSAGVAMVTLAPELPDAVDLVHQLAADGVVVAAGHTNATTADMTKALDAGVRYLTHLYNAMAPFHHREPGPIGVALTDRRVVGGLIADGIHVHPIAVAAAWDALGPARTNLVSDAIAALGQPAGTYRLGDDEVIVDDIGVRLPDGTLAGSNVGLDVAVANLRAFTGASVADAVATVTSTPATLLGLETKGLLRAGADADLTLLDADLHVVATIVAGRVVHQTARPGQPTGPGGARG